jgi:hypothetical protein
VLAMGPTAIPGTRRPPGLAWSSAGAFVSTALMTAVEPRQPGYLSHSDAATAPVDGFPDRQPLGALRPPKCSAAMKRWTP